MSTSAEKPPAKPGDIEIDVDDALIEPPKDDVFERKQPKDDKPPGNLKRRKGPPAPTKPTLEESAIEENLEPSHYRG